MADIGALITRLSPLFEKTVKQEYNLLFNSKSEARNLSANLVEIQKVLAEAERRRLTDPRVRDWLQKLHDVTYEIDDALDEWDAANFQIRNQEFGDDDDEDDVGCTWLKKVSIFFESVCLCFQLAHKHRDVALNIKGLNEKVESLAKETVKYSTLLPINSDPLNVKPKTTTSFSQFVVLKGQHDQKDKIIDELLTCYDRKDRVIDELQICKDLVGNIQVISLVGMAGIGKTTLAQLAFHDPRVQSSFKLRSWISLSHTHDEIRVTKSILQSLGVSYPEGADLQKLLELIQSSVRGNKFLFVIDNVWIEDDSFWRQLKGSLICGGALESIILVTSRNENVAKSMGSTRITKVECLSDSDCWLLFKEMAFWGRRKDRKENLETIGQRIAEKCGGLPLAAETLGHYLRSRYSKQLWEDVLEKELWQLEEVAEALFAPFALSYDELPLAMKHCFSYCGIWPKGKPIGVDGLIRLWMMQGYLISSDGTDDGMEFKGTDYFEELAARSFFLNVREDKLERYYVLCDMHGIVHDFAKYLMKTAGSKVEELRNSLDNDAGLSGNQLVRLKSVRVLGIGGGEKQEIPLEIGNLIHLRYLGLTTSKKLPSTICDLYNLHTLDLRSCEELSELPKRIHRLRNLRHLLLYKTDSLEWVPGGVGKLIHLRTLDEFKVGRGRSKLRYLADLNQIRGSMVMHIGDLNEDEDVEDAKKAQLGNKIYITDLDLRFLGEDVRLDVMEALQVPPNLQHLFVRRYIGTQLPSWINNTCLSKLRNLVLDKCEKCLRVPPLGTLPFLEELYIYDWRSLERVGPEFLGIIDEGNDSSLPPTLFPKLRKLWFSGCDLWEEWEDISSNTRSIMPCLRTLGIYGCPILKTLPHFLPPVGDFRTNRRDDLLLPSTIGNSLLW